MFSLKKWLGSLMVVAAISSPTLSSPPANDLNIAPTAVVAKQEIKKPVINSQETFEDFWKIYDGELTKEVGRRNLRLKDFEEWNLLQNYTFHHNNYLPFHLTPKENEMMEDYVWDVLEDAGDEFIDSVDFINELENDLRGTFSYEVFGTTNGPKKDRHYSPDLAEEERLEDKKQEEITTVNGRLEKYFGKGYEIHSGLSPYLRGGEAHIKAYTRLENFHLFGIPFRKAKLEVNSQEKFKFRLYKVLDDDWYASLSADIDNLKSEERIGLSLTKEFRNPRSRLSFLANQRDGKDVYVGFRYRAKF